MKNEVFPEIKVHHIALKVSDLEKSLRFYTEGLGFHVYRQWSNPQRTIALVDIGNGTCLEIFSNGEPHTADPDEAGDFVHLAFDVADTRAAFARAVSYGAAPLTEPKDMVLGNNPPMPVSLSFVKGPDGEQIEFFQPHERD